MIWLKFFDGIYVINLAHRTERLMVTAEELAKYDIPFERVDAIGGIIPQTCLVETFHRLFNTCRKEQKKRILVFEDDVEFIENPNNYMPQIIAGLDSLKWDILNLGPNTHEPFKKRVNKFGYAQYLLPMQNCRALHAVAYNYTGMDFILNELQMSVGDHMDKAISDQLQPLGNCYCTFPLLATQREGPSDIGKETSKKYIVERFERNVAHLL